MNKLNEHLRILGLSEPPHFADLFLEDCKQKLQEEDDFLIETQTINNTTIDLSKVMGTTHPDYVNYSWSKLLTDAKRIESNLNSIKCDPRQYIEDHCKTVEFGCLDNDHLFIENGNHRTCIAKFFLYGQGTSMLHGPKLRKYKIDLKFKTVYRHLENAIKKTTPRQSLSVEKTQTYSGNTTPGTFVVTYSLQAKLVNNGTVKHLDPQKMYEHIESLNQQKGLLKVLQKLLFGGD